MKKYIISAILVFGSIAANAGLSDGEAAILGIVIGSQLQRHSQQYEQPRQVQRNYPSGVYSQPPIRYNSDPCAGSYSSVDAAYCRGAQRRYQDEVRQMEQDAYNRGYNGSR